MGFIEMFLLAVGLSMDAFAVAVCKGLSMQKMSLSKAVIVGLWFGGFQALMPLIGYLLGTNFREQIEKIDHWTAFGLLVIIGGNMIHEAFSKNEDEVNDSIKVRDMFVLAIATSIDALAVGITLACIKVSVIPAISFIGIVTFGLSVIGVKVGTVFGTRYKSGAELAGGVILILLGTKILLEHLGWWFA